MQCLPQGQDETWVQCASDVVLTPNSEASKEIAHSALSNFCRRTCLSKAGYRLGSATLSQLAFRGNRNPNLPKRRIRQKGQKEKIKTHGTFQIGAFFFDRRTRQNTANFRQYCFFFLKQTNKQYFILCLISYGSSL